MLKAYFRVLRTIAFSAMLLMGSHAFGESSIQSQFRFFSPLKMPRYEQWKKLSPEARSRLIEHVQAFLLRADAMARSGDTAQNAHETEIIQRAFKLWDLWVETAQAKTRSPSRTPQQPYCINQGVVKPLNKCDTSLGYKMHDFDTNEILSKLGPASQCPAGEKPCSPFFGFTAEGQMICSSLNLTRDCAQKSAQSGTVTLANTLTACDAGSPGAAKVDCNALKVFFDQQVDAVNKLCNDAPKRFACGILKDQIQAVMAEKSEKNAAMSAVGAENVAQITAEVNKLAQMENGTAPCPPEASTQPAEAKAPAPKKIQAECVNKPYPKDLEAPVLDAIVKAMIQDADKSFTCGEMQLPNQGKFNLDFAHGKVQFQATSHSAPVTVDEDGFNILLLASHALLEEPLKIPAKDLLASYLPKEALKDAGKVTVPTQDPKQTKDYSTSGWVSANGTRIRYATDEKTNLLLLMIKAPGNAKEAIFPLPLKEDEGQAQPAEAGAKDSRALPSQPK